MTKYSKSFTLKGKKYMRFTLNNMGALLSYPSQKSTRKRLKKLLRN